MSNSWFTSDWHLFGINFLKNEKRNHFKDVNEMNSFILHNIISTTRKGDNLYFLGDIGWKFPEKYLEEFFTAIKKAGLNFFWIEGNHDADIKPPAISCIKWKGQIKDIKLEKQPITLVHYPMYVWNKSHYGAYLLHGHIHYKDNTWNILEKENINLRGKILNVNCELHNFKPLSFEEIHSILEKKESNFDLIERRVGYVGGSSNVQEEKREEE
jgi:calcineurin-like phosphoesterase family protein